MEMVEHREPYDARVCAVKTAGRIPYPRREEAGRDASGSTILPDGESLKGQEHGGKAGVRANMPDPTPRKARAIRLRLDCLNPSLQRWNVTSRATACQGAVGRIGRFTFAARNSPCRTTANEAVQGDERGTYVALTRSTRTDTGSPTGREAHGDGAVVVVRGRESRPHGEGPQVPRWSKLWR